jgi:hypothetical protein
VGWDREGISGCGLQGDEALQSTRRSEALHHPLSFPEGQVAVFGTVVVALMGPMIKSRGDLPLSGSIGAMLICDDPFGNEAQPFISLTKSRFAARLSRLD